MTTLVSIQVFASLCLLISGDDTGQRHSVVGAHGSLEETDSLQEHRPQEGQLLRRQRPAIDAVSLEPGSALVEMEVAAGGSTNSISNGTNGTKQVPFYSVIITILSNPHDRERRDGIRNSWGQYLDKSGLCSRCSSVHTVKYLFIVGNELDLSKEAKETDDIMVLKDFGQDEYTRLTQKVRRTLCQIVHEYNFDVLLKVDTDTFVFMDRFLNWTESAGLFQRPLKKVYAGVVTRNGTPNQSKNDKWYDGNWTETTGRKFLPDFMHGSGYLLSRGLVEFVASQHEHHCRVSHLRDLNNEDVSVGHWMEQTSHEVCDMPVAFWNGACDESKGGASLAMDHYILPAMMAHRWSNLKSRGTVCDETFVEATTALFEGWLQKLTQMAGLLSSDE